MALVVKNTFVHHSVEGGAISVLADSPTEPIPGHEPLRMLAEDAFDAGTPERTYVEAYGIIVGPENLRDRPDSEVDTYGGWTLYEDANGAWATRDAFFGHVTARRVDALYDLIDEYEEED